MILRLLELRNNFYFWFFRCNLGIQKSQPLAAQRMALKALEIAKADENVKITFFHSSHKQNERNPATMLETNAQKRRNEIEIL